MKTQNFGNPNNIETPVLYALVRFRPFAETEEFANIGVLVCCPKLSFMDYRIVHPNVNRVPQFFDRFERSQYRDIIKEFGKALKHLVERCKELDGAGKRYMFQAFVHPREASITLSTYRVVMSDDPKNELDRLFEHYVRQNFDPRISAEKQVENNVKAIIKATGRNFTSRTISERGLNVTFPFVSTHGENVHKIIKPLYLGHEKLNDVYEHGDVWAGKLKRVRSQLPDLTLFAIDGNRHPRAIREISEELLRQDVFVEPYSPDTIRNFAIQ